jgi:hypothetical protein
MSRYNGGKMMHAMIAALLVAAGGEVSEVGVHRTPGKPMQFFEPNRPAEEIVVRKEGDKFVLLVRVNVPRDGVKGYREDRAELTAKEWESIVEVVSKERLLDWKPRPEEGKVFDWGAAGILVKADRENAPTWTSPLKNADGPAALTKRLAALAAEKVKTLKLYYLGP